MTDEPDEKALVERIRAHLRDVPQSSVPAPSPRPPATPDRSAEAIEIDAAMLRDSVDVYDQPLRSQRALAPALSLMNRTMRKLLRPSLERQVSYNAANERLVRALRDQLEALSRAQRELEKRCDALEAQVDTLRARSRDA